MSLSEPFTGRQCSIVGNSSSHYIFKLFIFFHSMATHSYDCNNFQAGLFSLFPEYLQYVVLIGDKEVKKNNNDNLICLPLFNSFHSTVFL